MCGVTPVFMVAKGSAKVPWKARERAIRTLSPPVGTSKSFSRASGRAARTRKLTAATTVHQWARVHLGNLSRRKSRGGASAAIRGMKVVWLNMLGFNGEDKGSKA